MEEKLEDWLKRMEKEPKTKDSPNIDWVIDGHGHYLDPEVDVLDDSAKRRLKERNR